MWYDLHATPSWPGGHCRRAAARGRAEVGSMQRRMAKALGAAWHAAPAQHAGLTHRVGEAFLVPRERAISGDASAGRVGQCWRPGEWWQGSSGRRLRLNARQPLTPPLPQPPTPTLCNGSCCVQSPCTRRHSDLRLCTCAGNRGNSSLAQPAAAAPPALHQASASPSRQPTN